MQIALPERATSATLILDDGTRLTDEEYFAFCEANPDLNVERTAQGDIVIVPPAGLESDDRNIAVTMFLRQWAEKDARGRAFGPTAQFLLPDGSGLSADASWVSHQKLSALSAAEKKRFPKVVPEFVIEVMSPSDRLRSAQRKMRQWAGNGVELGWLIDGDGRCIYVYRGTAEPRLVNDAESIAGEGPVEGFVLPLSEIWRGLQG